MKRRWLAILTGIIALMVFTSAAMGESDAAGIEITVGGIPLEEMIGAASEMFADAVEENMGNAIQGLNDVLNEFAGGFSRDLAKIGDTMKNIPFDYFCYSNSGSSTYEIYSYELGRDEESGEWTVICELMCGYESYKLPADEKLLQDLAAVIEAHSLRDWDGFNESDSLVMDGCGFSMEIDFADGSGVHAHGNNSFPGGFDEAKEAIDKIFRSYLEKNGVDTQMYF